MEFERDFLMRQIAMMCRTIRALATGKTEERNSSGEAIVTGGEKLRERLLTLLEEDRIDEAENILFDSAESGDMSVLLYGAEFYDRLNAWSDEKLVSVDFSRDEIAQGLRDLSLMFGVGGILDIE